MNMNTQQMPNTTRGDCFALLRAMTSARHVVVALLSLLLAAVTRAQDAASDNDGGLSPLFLALIEGQARDAGVSLDEPPVRCDSSPLVRCTARRCGGQRRSS